MNKFSNLNSLLGKASVLVALSLQTASCAKISLVPVIPQVSNNVRLNASFCPQVRHSDAGKSKFAFVIDLSRSNFGKFREIPENSGYYFFDSSQAKDFEGVRFDAVEDFIENCGSELGDSYSIIGFSSQAGIIKSSEEGSILSCSNLTFKSKEKAIEDLHNIKQAHLSERSLLTYFDYSLGRYYQTDNIPKITKFTSYSKAIDCFNSVLFEDLTSADSTAFDNYKVFFVSDGAPKDDHGTGCEREDRDQEQSKDVCYLEQARNSLTKAIQSSLAKDIGLRFFSVFYGEEDVPSVLEVLSIEGETKKVHTISEFRAGKNVFCEILDYQLGFEYRPESMSVLNLTTLAKEDYFYADSDMDGVSDEDEIFKGWDPVNSRSLGVSGVLDGVCERLGGVEECRKLRGKINCSPENTNEWGLTECDIKIMDLPYSEELNANVPKSWGVDSDLDGIVDYIEIIKHTNPKVADANVDTDGDGYSNFEEIVRGLDPNHFNESFLVPKTNEFQFSRNFNKENSCSAGVWNVSLIDIQSQYTLQTPFSDGQGWFDGGHLENEQIVLLTYRLSSQNQARGEYRYFGGRFQVQRSFTGQLTPLKDTSTLLVKDDFEKNKWTIYRDELL